MTKAEAQAKNHVEWIKHPDWWPMFGICPLKHSTRKDPNAGGMPLTGVVVSCDDPGVVRIGVLGITNFSQAPQEKFDSVEAMVAAGWVVD
jgi:hypothetical protein